MARLTRDYALLEVARIFSKRGTCLRLQVGAVIARAGRIISTGYVGAPSGIFHCDENNCGPDRPCERTVHAELNAILFAARWGISVEGASLYTTYSPCYGCAQAIINAGIKEVFWREAYRDPSGMELLREAGIECHDPGTVLVAENPRS